MMLSNRSLSIALAVATLLMMMPNASATDVVTEEYVGALGASSGMGYSYATIVNAPNDYAPVPAIGRVPTVGGAHLRADGLYDAVTVSANDAIYGSEIANALCFWASNGDGTCNPGQDVVGDVACGSQVLTTPLGMSGRHVTVWTFTIHIENDLEVCSATTGTITGIFF